MSSPKGQQVTGEWRQRSWDEFGEKFDCFGGYRELCD